MSEKIFVTGLFFKKPSPKAPDFIIGSLSAKREELIAFLMLQTGEWTNMSIKESKGGKIYIELDQWKPAENSKKESKEEIPF